MTVEIRSLTDDDLPQYLRAYRTGFLLSPDLPDARTVQVRRRQFSGDRLTGAFDGDRCVATFRSFPQEVTAVGGAPVPASAVSQVSVSATHRRQGLLSRMMSDELTAARERGDVMASLVAAEYPIYGRFGFGPATRVADWSVDVARAQLDRCESGPADGGSLRLADGAEVRRVGPPLHQRFRAVQPGAVSRTPIWWELATGAARLPERPWREPFHVVYRDAAGEVRGLATYTTDDTWQAMLPKITLTVRHLLAETAAAERALWRYLLSVDWVATVVGERLAPDSLLPHLLGDARAARITALADFLWLRPLDVPRMLELRRYPTAGSLVLQVHDAAGLAGGRYLLDATEEGAQCTVTTREPDLSLDVGELGALYLGDHSVARLAALGRVTEERPGAVARADTLLHTPRSPWCPDVF